jgi:rod shape-determining protein MreC
MKVSWTRLLGLLGTITVLYFLIVATPIGGPVKNVVSFITTPIFSVASRVTRGISDFFGAVFSISELQKENEQMKKQIAELQGENAKLLEMKKENEQLRSALAFQEESGGKLLPAEIIGKDPNSFLQEIKIDKGTSSGVKKGMAVVYGGVLIGRIKESEVSSANVTLIISPKSAVPAMTQEGRVLGILRGQVGYGLILEEVPIEEKISVGERLISSGLGSEYPQGLILGDIEKVETDQNKIFQTAQVKMPVNFKKLEQVFVMIK